MSQHAGSDLAHSLVATYETEWTHRDTVLPHMIDYHLAHQVAAAAKGFVPRDMAAKLCEALRGLRETKADDLPFDARLDGFHPCLEARIRKDFGADVAGWLNAGRARQEIEMVSRLMAARSALLEGLESLCRYRAALLAAAAREAETVIPWQTWLQPAEVATAGYIFEASALAAADDFDRLFAGLGRANRSRADVGQIVPPPMAFDRSRVAEFLGMTEPDFGSSVRAYAAADTECAIIGDLSVAAGNMARLSETLYLWCSAEFGLAQFSDAFTGTSHIMPQKRNPYALRTVRPMFTRIAGRYQDALHLFAGSMPAIGNGVVHIPNRTIDCATDFSLIGACMADALATVTFNKDRGLEALKGSWCQAPQLVFTLVSEAGIPYRSAHTLAAALVKSLGEQDRAPESMTPDDIASAAEASIGETVTLSAESLRAVLGPRAIVESRSDGGPAPEALRERLERAAKQLENDLAAMKEVQVRIETGRSDLEREVDALIGG